MAPLHISCYSPSDVRRPFMGSILLQLYESQLRYFVDFYFLNSKSFQIISPGSKKRTSLIAHTREHEHDKDVCLSGRVRGMVLDMWSWLWAL